MTLSSSFRRHCCREHQGHSWRVQLVPKGCVHMSCRRHRLYTPPSYVPSVHARVFDDVDAPLYSLSRRRFSRSHLHCSLHRACSHVRSVRSPLSRAQSISSSSTIVCSRCVLRFSFRDLRPAIRCFSSLSLREFEFAFEFLCFLGRPHLRKRHSRAANLSSP